MNYDVMALIERKKFGSPGRKAVIKALAHHINDPLETDVWPSASNIALRAEISTKTVSRSLKELASKGLIKHVADRIIRGGKVKVWRVDLKAIFALPNCIPTLEETLSELPDKMSTGQTTTGQIDHRPPDTESTGHRTNIPTNSPEETSKGIVQGNARAISEKLWLIAPDRARKRSSKDKTLKAVQKAIAKTDGQNLIDCYQRYLNDPEVEKQGYAFACGIHVWLNDSRWQGYEVAKPNLLTEAERGDAVANAKAKHEAKQAELLDWLFAMLAQHGSWHGGNKGFPVDPRDPDADYPAELYAKHGISQRKPAA